MATIEFCDVTKHYPDGTEAVNQLHLRVEDGEFMIFVGPSGCGKSTALRMIAGLEEISSGELLIDGGVVNNLAPKDRDIAMVFQSYALYPHMTVRRNMGFALKLAGAKKDEIARKVAEAAHVLDLTPHLDRKPAQLSGGQRQRVAMGRAIVRDPKVFLMDEPLSNLDAKLRVQMRTEVARIQERLGSTTVYVTHDQTEAMTLGDRVAVMRLGVLQQVGSPKELYARPANLFVAGFIGSPSMNFFSASVEHGRLRLPFGELPTPPGVHATGALVVGLRPEDFEDTGSVERSRAGGIELDVQVSHVESIGSDVYAYFAHAGEAIRSEQLSELSADPGVEQIPGVSDLAVARLHRDSPVRAGETARLWVDGSKLHVFDHATGVNLACA